MREHLDRVVHDHPEVIDSGIAGAQQAMPDARLMYLDPEKVAVRVFGGLLDQSFTVAEADFEHNRRRPTEQSFEIERFLRVFDTIIRPELAKCALL